MDAAGLAFSSQDFLSLIESKGLTGNWGWTFATNEHVWSVGLFRLLGLEPGTVRPGYDVFLDLVHPEDRSAFETPSQVRFDGVMNDRTFRIIRPDGTVRILSSRNEVFFQPGGRPRGAASIVLDITDRECLARALAAERHRRRALFESHRSFMFSNTVGGEFFFPEELFLLTGLTPEEIADDAFRTIVPEEREHWREGSIAAQTEGRAHASAPRVPLAGGCGETGRFAVFTVPVRNGLGTIVDWASVTRPFDASGFVASDSALEGLEQAVEGRHLRAARGLLDWSMADLAGAAGLSLSTVRRLEDGGEAAASRSRHRAIAALRNAGIRFSLTASGSIALAVA